MNAGASQVGLWSARRRRATGGARVALLRTRMYTCAYSRTVLQMYQAMRLFFRNL